MTDILILDNGAYSAKIGFASNDSLKVIPNCIMKAKSERRRPFIGDQIKDCRDASGLFYILPFQRGFIINFDVQKSVWDYMFSQDCCSVSFTNHPIMVTHPVFNFHSVQEAMAEIFFEEYEFDKMLPICGVDLVAYKYYQEQDEALACLVIDMGYSFTHVVPYLKDKKWKKGIRRIDVGGKLLTNHLKEVISYRQLNVMDESYVINQAKEDCCFVSQDFGADMEVGKRRGTENHIIKEYVLPDFTTVRRGFMRELDRQSEEDQQTLVMNNERFAIPEIFFHPSDIGIQQMGVPEAVMDAIKSCPAETIEHLLGNIIVCGGSAMFPGMKSRLQKEIRALAPALYKVNVTMSESPISAAWEGGQLYQEQPDILSQFITRDQYEESGNDYLFERSDI